MTTHTQKTVRLQGAIYGWIWQPGPPCWKELTVRQDSFLERPRACDYARSAIAAGDFRSARLASDSEFVFERTTLVTDDEGRVVRESTRKRFVPVTRFASIADCVGDKETWELPTYDAAA